MVQGSKKQNKNGNHLLNFKLAPRHTLGGSNSYNVHYYNRWHSYAQRHKYDKDQFLQANCQFVVTANGDYSQYLINEENNVDKLIDWELIQQIRIQSSENLSCPICLYPPVAAKMTRCGHVYCWPCILKYLSLSEEPGPKCPVCYYSVYKAGLKSVKIIINEDTLNIGNEITLRLMRREKKSLISMPVGDTEIPVPAQFLSISEKSCKEAYSKLLLAQEKDIEDIINLEQEELENELSIEKNLYPDSHTIPFIEQGLNELKDRKELIKTIYRNENKFRKLAINELASDCENQENLCKNAESEFKVGEKDFYNEYASSSDPEIAEPPKYHYFYQAETGQNVYLLAMNVKMLEMQYGSLEKSPLKISGTLLQREVGSIDEERRGKMRYLAHLPVTSQFEFVEIDLGSFVSDEVLRSFQSQINSRQSKRKKQERQERRREKKITEEENIKIMGKYPSANVHIDSRKHFPQFQPESELDEYIPSSQAESIASSLAGSPSTNNSFDELMAAAGGEINSWSSLNSRSQSFAQMLQNSGPRKSFTWSPLNTSARKSQVGSLSINTQPEVSADPDMEEYLPPTFNQSLSDAVVRALENKDLMSQDGAGNDGTPGKKKKKKSKATVLFATNMARAS
ncbi:RING finger protein 10 isoform X2 [Copidosoma floridanum]|nr:RING finger protein 10 isoform X2 [Copidosoma floridanum]